MTSKPSKLKREFYTRSVLKVAKELLGKIIVKNENGIILSGKIVEVEAYDGILDEAAHTYGGMTERNKIMFDEGGFLYVYFTYGVHYCSNIVTGKEGRGTAVLLRGIEPLEGIEQMAKNKYSKKEISQKEKVNLTNGPGKICRAFDINKRHYGIDLTSDYIFLLDQPKLKPKEIAVSKRIGIRKSVHLPWRFYIKNNPFVSKK
jgi:DNA-3-methyladenine glycosylase